jgi:glutathione S-transferase
MITLYGFGPAWGLTDPSPFVAKTETLLKMAGLPYRTARGSFAKAPKGKIPYIEDEGALIGDSTLIRWHLERKYGVDFDAGLGERERAVAWSFEKMVEDQLYWAFVRDRWLDRDNFDRGPRLFFASVPAPLRPLVIAVVRRKLRSALRAHGMGRHSNAEIVALGSRSIDAIATFLADKPFFMGERASSIDATLFGFVSGALVPRFDSKLREAAERHDNLRRYLGRLVATFYPELDEVAGCKAAA